MQIHSGANTSKWCLDVILNAPWRQSDEEIIVLLSLPWIFMGLACPVLWIWRALPIPIFHRKTSYSRKRKMMKTNQSFIGMWSWDSHYFSNDEFIHSVTHPSSDSFHSFVISLINIYYSHTLFLLPLSQQRLYLPKASTFFW